METTAFVGLLGLALGRDVDTKKRSVARVQVQSPVGAASQLRHKVNGHVSTSELTRSLRSVRIKNPETPRDMESAKASVLSPSRTTTKPDVDQRADEVLDSVRQRRLHQQQTRSSENDEEDDEGDEEEEDDDQDHYDEEELRKRKRRRRKKKNSARDSVRSYLQEIGKTKLLKAENEIELARSIQVLLKFEKSYRQLVEQVGREPSDVEWAQECGYEYTEFMRTLHRGRLSKEKMVAANLRLVVSIAKKYLNRGLSFQDLIQEGSIGLIKGTEKFDADKGFKFSTYATWWIRQSITRAIADFSRPIRLPVHINDTITTVRKITKALEAETGNAPSEAEIAQRMEIPVDKLRFVLRCARSTLSLETPIGKPSDKENTTLASFIEWDGESPEEKTEKSLLREDLENVLNTLNPRERDVIRMRYGLDDGKAKTLEEIGAHFSVTRERIRQIESKALRKLRSPTRNNSLKEYVYGS